MKVKSVFVLGFLTLMAFPLHATTVKWLAEPEYDAISYYNKDIFKCKKDGKYQLIDFTGKKLLKKTADSITEFCNGYALVLDFLNENDRGRATENFFPMRIIGILAEKTHRFVEVDGNFHTNFYSHFSDEMLVVANDKDGKLGYLNTEAKLTIPCSYKYARPFIKGWASVVQVDKRGKNKWKYINRNEKPLTVYFNEGILSFASSFNEKGEALVLSDKNEMALIDVYGKKMEEKVLKFNTSDIKDHIRGDDYAYNDDAEEYNPPHNEMPTFRKDIFPFSSGLSYGYMLTKTDTLLMPQFTFADMFAEDCVIVAFNGKYGVITLVDGEFSSTLDNMSITFNGTDAQEINYILNVPEDIEAKQLEISFDNGEGEMRGLDLVSGGFRQTGLNEYTYKFTPQMEGKNKSCTIRAEVRTKGLLLWNDTKKLGVQNLSANTSPDVEVFFVKVDEKADVYDKLSVKVKVNNNTDEPIDVSVAFSIPELHNGNQILSAKTTEGSVGARQKNKLFPITFKVVQQEEISMKVTVTIIGSDQKPITRYKKVTLNPNDI